MKTAIVNKDTYTITSIYEGTAKYYSGPWSLTAKYEHVEFDDSILGDIVLAQDNAGSIEIIEDVQSNRDSKLVKLREELAKKLKAVDIEIKKHDDGDVNAVGTAADQKNYRVALRDATVGYKDVNDNQIGAASLDSVANDASDFAYPTKPS